MASIRAWLLALVAAAGVTPAFAAPLEAYGRLPSIETADLSASGDQVAVIVTNGEERRIVVKDLVKNTVTFIASAGNTKVRALQWAGDRHLILTISRTRGEGFAFDRSERYFAFDVDVARKSLTLLSPEIGEEDFKIILGMPIVRLIGGRPSVFLHGLSVVNSQEMVSLTRIDLDDQSRHRVEPGRPYGEGFLVGPDGRVLAEPLWDVASGKWSLRLKTASGWRAGPARRVLVDEPDVLGLGRDGQSIIVTEEESDGFIWREVSLNTGEPGATLSTGPAQSPIHDPVTGRLIGFRTTSIDELRYVFFDPNDARVWKAVEAAFGGDRVELASWSDDRRKILVRVDSATAGPAYAIVDLASRHATWLGNEYEGVKPEDISPVRPVHYTASDGLELNGYLTLPRGRDPKGLPLVVLPHGGPASRDDAGFDWWAQAMASRGYAVLQVNFRGSSGFGWPFEKAGFGQWGRKMQTDLSDGVQMLAQEGVVDPKRVCIVGGSYGGYAALAGVTIQHGIYRCAVSVAGVADLKKMVSKERYYENWDAFRYWTRFMGAEDAKDPVLAKYSPALHAADADAPILLIHGKDDSVVPLEQSTEMADALKAAGKPVQLIVQNHADHWLSLGATRLQMLQATMAFVEKNNPPN